jgi:hypothetical protein
LIGLDRVINEAVRLLAVGGPVELYSEAFIERELQKAPSKNVNRRPDGGIMPSQTLNEE